MEAQGADGDQELPAVALPAGFGHVFQVGVVENPETHGGDADLMDGLGHAFILGGLTSLPVSEP